ncbi:Glycosyltransferase-like domain-containing protein 1 [Bulinus truncatus]|nr:Glycosyltransferase-like domain-containing protein 1 [Bulinus truncatus]
MTQVSKDVLIIEPFFGGSHQVLIKILQDDEDIGPRCIVCSLPAKKWQWRARTSALYFSQTIPFGQYKILFASSVLNLAELIALRPDLAQTQKIIYFHENQLIYPVQQKQDRDFQYGYNQILTCLVADKVVFNSAFNMKSFLSTISSHLKLIPDHRPKNLHDQIRPKCQVLYFPLVFHENDLSHNKNISLPDVITVSTGIHVDDGQQTLFDSPAEMLIHSEGNILNHEISLNGSETEKSLACHTVGSDLQKFSSDNKTSIDAGGSLGHETDTKPAPANNSSGHITRRKRVHEEVFETKNCISLYDTVVPSDTHLQACFQCLHIVWPHRWEHDKDPESFFNAVLQLQAENYNFFVSVIGETFSEVPEIFHTAKGLLRDKIIAWGYQTRENYLKILDSAHVVVSTALHEFFGVSMLEAVGRKCYPLCPKRLVYPEIYPEECLYSTQKQLVKRLKRFCQKPSYAVLKNSGEIIQRFSWTNLRDSYRTLLLGQ